MQLVL